ncbi:MAG: hypothetical protein LJE70_01775 [Chromatiaceae bacterium]|nr:hypothetical protein [Chromatiaceae bacterium]
MLTVLLLGFLIGIQHALEADHVAAVASLATRSRSIADTVRQGAAWGLGHTLTLLFFGSLVLLLDAAVSERVAEGLELAVACMLILLGADVLRRLLRDRVHFHRHRHGNVLHMHAHSHTGAVEHALDPHSHAHLRGLPIRALLVGMMHGMAGTAALMVLALKTIATPLQGFLYILLFGVGSMVGMAALAAIISLPLSYSARSLTWAHNGLQLLVGLFTIGLGGLMAYQITTTT